MSLSEHLPGELRGDRRLAQLISITLLAKVSILLLVGLVYYLLPFNAHAYMLNFRYPADEWITLSSAYKTWDGHHYSYLAEHWYSSGLTSNAFYPLYPLIVKASRFLFLNHTLFTGIALSNLFAVLSLILLYLFTKNLFGENVAYYTALFYLAFPTSYYTGLMYSESLFLFLALLLFYSLYRNRLVAALAASALLPLTRPQGILLLVPLAVYLLLKVPALPGTRVDRRYLLPLAFVAGFCVYLGIMRAATGIALAGFVAQRSFVAQNSLANVVHPWRWFRLNFVDVQLSLHGFTNSIIDRVFFVLFLFLLVVIFRHLDKTMFAYAAAVGLTVALSGTFMAYSRYLLTIFPIYIVLGYQLKERHYLVTVPSAFVQLLFLTAHSLNYWIA